MTLASDVLTKAGLPMTRVHERIERVVARLQAAEAARPTWEQFEHLVEMLPRGGHTKHSLTAVIAHAFDVPLPGEQDQSKEGRT